MLFAADYTLSIGGQKVGKAHRELHQVNVNSYLFETTADAGMLAHASERSYFSVTPQGQILPTHYHLERQMLFEHRHTDLLMDWETKKLITQTERDPQRSFELTANTLDKLSVEIQMRRDLASPHPALSYPLADADGIRTYVYNTGTSETLNTAIGTLSTLKVEHSHVAGAARYTTFWVAPSLNFLPVRVLQQEHGTTFLLEITAVHFQKPTTTLKSSLVQDNSAEDVDPKIDLDKLQAPEVPASP